MNCDFTSVVVILNILPRHTAWTSEKTKESHSAKSGEQGRCQMTVTLFPGRNSSTDKAEPMHFHDQETNPLIPIFSLVNKTNLVHNLSSLFISILYMFWATLCPSSGEITVSIRRLVFVTLCG
jgi:hypothetical protein